MKTNKTFWSFLNLCSNPTNAHYYNVLSHIINYQHVSIDSDANIRVALHEYYEYYKQPNSISGTTQRYDRFFFVFWTVQFQ